MSLTFYYSPMSTASITESVLAELETPCERVKVDFRAGDTKKPEFLAVNPNAKIPAIVHEGVSVWESAAITMYLGEAFGVEKNLYPASGPKRGVAMKWITWANVTLMEAAHRLMRNADDAAAQKDIGSCLSVLDSALAGREFLCDGYTITDTHVHSIVSWLGMMKVDTSTYANVSAWMKRCQARPAIVKMMESYKAS